MEASIQQRTPLPLVALVGRPNVGKSTLFNRLVGRRQALVDDRPGVTRDRLFAEAELSGHLVQLVDTGGLEFDDQTSILAQMQRQTTLAIEAADLVLFIVDAASGVLPTDEEIARLLRKSGKPTIVVGNKIDAEVHEDRLAEVYRLGLEPVVGCSAEHGRNVFELVDAVLERVEAPLAEDVEAQRQPLPVQEDAAEAEASTETTRIEWQEGGVIRVAVVGQPNVGKSSLINRLLGEERMVASDVAGTTRDVVDVQFVQDGQPFVFLDTAGIRRKSAMAEKLERLSVMMAKRSMEDADVVLVVLDGAARPSVQDARIAALADESGKGLVLVANKWDLVENPEWIEGYPKAIQVDLPFAAHAPLVRISAKTGRNMHKLFAAITDVQRERHRRVSTGELNRFFKDVVEHHPPPGRKGKRPRLYFVSQPLVRPPTFIFTTSGGDPVPTTYERYLRNALRQRYGFAGTPLWLKFRKRGKQATK